VYPLWSQTTTAPLRGLALARERGWLIAWDEHHWLSLLNLAGERQGLLQAPAPLTAVCCADDGSAFATAGTSGQVWFLAPDLMPRWERTLPRPALALALDPFANYLAAADDSGGLYVFDRLGRTMCQTACPRPLWFLAFVPERPVLVGSAEFGLVASFDLTGRCQWRDGLVAHVGSLATSGDGSLIALACFSEGLCAYSLDLPQRRLIPSAGPCRMAALTFDGRLALTAGLDNRIRLTGTNGQPHDEWNPEGIVVSLALGPLGDYAVVGLADGKMVGLALANGQR
jgi:hypothetical protein